MPFYNHSLSFFKDVQKKKVSQRKVTLVKGILLKEYAILVWSN